MAGKIKGITIAMEADTTGVTKGLKEITSESVNVSKNLKSVNSLLKLDPGNTTLIAEQQKLLAQNIETTKQKLNALKAAEDDVNKAYQSGKINTDEYIAYQSELVKTEKRLNDLESELSDSEKALDETGNEARNTAGDFQEAEKETGNLGEALKSGLATAAKVAMEAIAVLGTAAVASIKGIVDASGEVAEYGDNIDKMSQKIGISAQAYQEWDFIMQHSGASVDSLQAGMKTLSKVITEAGNGSESASEKLSAVGLSIDDLNGKSTDEQLNMVITALQGMESGAERTAAATSLLGKSGTEMGALFNTSAADTEAMRQQVHDLGAVMSDEAVGASAQYQDSLQNLQTAFGGVKNNLVSDFLPAITSVMDGLTGVISGTGSVEDLANGIEQFAGQLEETVGNITEAATTILPEIASAIVKNLPQILQSGVEIIMAIVEGIVDSLPEIMPAVIELITFLGQELINIAPQLLEAGIQIILQLADALVEALPEMMPAITQMIMDIVMMLTQPDTLMSLLEAALAIIQALGQGLLASLPILLENLPTIIDNILQFLVQATPQLIEAGVQLFVALVENLPAILEGIGTALLEIWNSIQTYFEGQFENIMNIGSQLFEDFKAGIEEIFPKIKEGIKGLLENVKQIIRNVFTAIKTLGSTLIENFKQGISSVVSRVTTVISNLISDIQSTINSIIDKALGFGESLINNLKQGISNTVGGVTTAISNMVSNISNGISDAVDDAWNWGVDLIQNFIDGIGHMFDNLRNTVSNVADMVKDFIGFSEPDKGPLSNFHTYAPDMMKLFAQGIKENAWRIEDELKKSLSTVSNGLQFDSLASVTLLPNMQSTSAPTPTMIDNSRTIYQTNNSPKALTRLEIYRQTRNAVNMT